MATSSSSPPGVPRYLGVGAGDTNGPLLPPPSSLRQPEDWDPYMNDVIGWHMDWDGFEIDMLAVGDADALLLTEWSSGRPQRVLVDGGNPRDASTVVEFLRYRGIDFIDHVVNTHLDADHIGGLIRVVSDGTVKFGQAWMHIPERHLDKDELLEELGAKQNKYARLLTASLNQSSTLHDTLSELGIVIQEPFEGTRIGFLTVCGPSEDYYESLLPDFRALDVYLTKIAALKEQEQRTKTAGHGAEGRLLKNPATSAENSSSCILATKQQGLLHVLTSDAGTEALNHATKAYDLRNPNWMQLPHHGSRHNLNLELIKYFSPKVAWVSAAGNDDHPDRAVIHAFQECGTEVYGTCNPSKAALWRSWGRTPERSGYGPATPF